MAVAPKANLDDLSELAARIIAAHPDAAAKTLGRRLQAESNGALTLDQAYARIRYLLGLKGAKHRKVSSRMGRPTRPPRQAGQVYSMPASKADSWEPHVLDVTGPIGILSDIHVPFHSEVALRAAVDALAGDRVQALILNGDTADFYAISRWTKNPAKRNFKGELAAIRELLGWIRQTFPEIPIVFKAGNHEERWNHWLYQHAPEISDEPEMGLAHWLRLAEHGMTLVEDQRPVMAGRLPVLHGHEKGKGISAPVNQARGAFLRLHHTVLEGHGHRTSGHCEPDMFGAEVFCWSTGCLCDLRPEYARINKWNHGFAVATVHADGSFDVANQRITAEGKVRTS
jgi:predicted phosphodiesterase